MGDRKMKRKLLSLFLMLALVFSMTACSMPNLGGTAVCQHRDTNDDNTCDKCNTYYTDGKDIPEDPICQHRDKDDDSLCDKCDEPYTDGKDIPDAPVCQHRDADDNGVCDKCYNDYEDGKDIPDAPICQHRDADDDSVCDKCEGNYEDGKDIPDCQHRDENDDAKCDKCAEAYEDGIDIPHVHSGGAWTQYGNDESLTCDEQLLYRICDDCGEIEWKNGGYDNHSFQLVTYKPTCQAQGYDEKTCTVCGFVDKVNYTPVADHDYKTEYITDASFHWLECKNCDATKGYAEHTVDDSGFCTTCNAPLAPTEGIIYDVSADGTYAEVIAYNGTATKILIADTYNGLPVRNIYQEAFYNIDSITSVVIPDSVTTIGSYAFAYCTSLTSVVIGDSVTTIGDHAFYDCDRLTSVVIPDSVTSISKWAFGDCNSLTSVVIPDSVTSIGGAAFGYCRSLASVTILGAPEVSSSAFSYCNSALYAYGRYIGDAENPYAILIELTNKNLSTYTIHEDTKVIASDAFSECERLTSITIPDSVKAISYGAFEDCDSLTSVVIPDSVTSIGKDAFYSCNSLTSIKYRGTQAQWNAISKGSGWSSNTGSYTITYNYTGE